MNDASSSCRLCFFVTF